MSKHMKLTRNFAQIFALSFLFAGALAQAATVTGTVTDKTTDKPAAGDAVVLVEPMSGMSEVGHATTDAKGHYSFDLPGSNPYLIRVMHQGAEYFVAAPQGGGTGDVSVYDVAAKVDGVTISERVVGIESDNGQLRVVERYDVHNESTPPRTQWSKRSFEVILPEDAVLGGRFSAAAGRTEPADQRHARPRRSQGPLLLQLSYPAGRGRQRHALPDPVQPAVQQRQIHFSFPGDAARGHVVGSAAQVHDV